MAIEGNHHHFSPMNETKVPFNSPQDSQALNRFPNFRHQFNDSFIFSPSNKAEIWASHYYYKKYMRISIPGESNRFPPIEFVTPRAKKSGGCIKKVMPPALTSVPKKFSFNNPNRFKRKRLTFAEIHNISPTLVDDKDSISIEISSDERQGLTTSITEGVKREKVEDKSFFRWIFDHCINASFN